ncbi:MAG: HD domain-containing protein, partial [Bacteroidota bacterium]
GHALGAMALMQDALQVLAEKGTPISHEERLAALAGALLHDVGHAPFSHTLETTLIRGFHHELMSRALIVDLDNDFDGRLGLTLEMFDGTYPRPFFHELIASQLDMDRLDYLRRDTFYTGVAEGVVGVDRLIKTLQVIPEAGGPESRLVVEAKGTYAAENYILARRLMYWQVYLHKTVLAGDHLLRAAFRRIRRRPPPFPPVEGSPALMFFLSRIVEATEIDDPVVRATYLALDDTDVLYSLKRWQHDPDPVLADLSRRFINRDFFRVTVLDEPPGPQRRAGWKASVVDWLLAKGLATPADVEEVALYYLTFDDSRHRAYSTGSRSICILERDGTLRELSESGDTTAISAVATAVVKPYVCAPKEVGV